MVEYDDDINEVFSQFTAVRQRDAVAICDLAMYNYIEVRSH